MKITRLQIPDVLLIEPRLYEDERGFFFESFNQQDFLQQTGLHAYFVQDNVSRSIKYVLRGLHYQTVRAQDKLVRVTAGDIYDVAVDLRKSSPTLGQYVGTRLSAQARQSLWIPCGFAHGFMVLSDFAEILYKVTDYWQPQHERRIIWNDPDLSIQWPLAGAPVLSSADLMAPRFREAELFP